MAVLGDRFGRRLAPPTVARYYEALSATLTTEEFVAAAQVAFKRDKFWPSPDALIQYVKPVVGSEVEAMEQFEKVLVATDNIYTSRRVRMDTVLALGAITERTFRAVGAFNVFEGLTIAERPFLARRFVEAYQHIADHEKAQEVATAALANADARVKALAPVASARALPSSADVNE